MYIPRHFEVTDRDEIFSFIDVNSFGQLISDSNGRMIASHIPFLIDKKQNQLQCHLARQNPQWQSIEDQEVLIIFPGPHDYISPSWYKSPGVPTWNYQAVHIYGRCRVFDSTNKLKDVVNALTRRHESNFEQPWVPDYEASMLKAIIGIEVDIIDIECKFKLNQNRSREDQLGVKKQLESTGLPNTSRVMKITRE